jgi:hypothetical protein
MGKVGGGVVAVARLFDRLQLRRSRRGCLPSVKKFPRRGGLGREEFAQERQLAGFVARLALAALLRHDRMWYAAGAAGTCISTSSPAGSAAGSTTPAAIYTRRRPAFIALGGCDG